MAGMIKQNISEKFGWQAKGVSPNDFEKASLCLELGNGYMNMAVFSGAKELLLLKSFHDKALNIKEDSFDVYYENVKDLQHSFAKVFVNFLSTKHTLVPKAFYREENRAFLYDFNAGIGRDQMVLSDKIDRMDAVLLYPVNLFLKRSVDKYFPNHVSRSGMTGILEEAASDIKTKELALLNFRPDVIDLVLSNGSVVFCNSFAVMAPEDMLFFLLTALEQNGFNPQKVKLIISGETETNSLWIKLLKKYIKNISFAVIDKQFRKPLEIQGVPAHYYYHLLNTVNCG